MRMVPHSAGMSVTLWMAWSCSSVISVWAGSASTTSPPLTLKMINSRPTNLILVSLTTTGNTLAPSLDFIQICKRIISGSIVPITYSSQQSGQIETVLVLSSFIRNTEKHVADFISEEEEWMAKNKVSPYRLIVVFTVYYLSHQTLIRMLEILMTKYWLSCTHSHITSHHISLQTTKLKQLYLFRLADGAGSSSPL